MTNFYSLREFYAWDANQSGELSFPAATNLMDVQAQHNRYSSADFSNQSHLWRCWLADNCLTNLVLSNCTSLAELYVQNNRLSTNALDSVLAFLDSLGGTLGAMDLSGNGCPSPLGYSHFTNIHNRLPTNSWVDYPSDYSNQVVGDTNSITFVTMNSYPTFRIDVAGATNIFWHWGDGTTASNLTVASNDFGHAYVRTNYVRVLPREALTGLGAPNGDNGGGGQAYLTIFGLTNFPNLEALRLWNDGVKHLDITNCPALRHLYLAGNYEPQSETDNWFIALNDAVTNPVSNTVFFYNSPDDPVWWGQTNAPTQISDQARASLQDKNWNLQRWHQ